MKSAVDISVIIPCYNSLQFVADAIDSVFRSTHASLEIIVVDDGSREPVEPYLTTRYPGVKNLKCIRQENRGLSGARNSGIRESSGEFLVFLDADDLILPDKLEKQLEFFRTHSDVDLVYSLSEWFTGNDPEQIFPVRFPVYEGKILSNLLFGNFIHVNSVMLPRKTVLDAGGFDEALKELEDWDLWLRLAIAEKSFACIPLILSKVRVHTGSMTTDQLKMNRTMVRVLLKNKPDILLKSRRQPGLKTDYYKAVLNFCLLAKQEKDFRKFYSEAFREIGPGFIVPGFKLLLKGIRSFFYTPVNQTTKELEHVWRDKKAAG